MPLPLPWAVRTFSLKTRSPLNSERAVQRLKKKRDFHTHVLIYVAVNAFLVAIWAVTSGGYFWPIFPILGWGIAVVANAWDVYGRKPISEEEIRREADRLRG